MITTCMQHSTECESARSVVRTSILLVVYSVFFFFPWRIDSRRKISWRGMAWRPRMALYYLWSFVPLLGVASIEVACW